MCVCVCVCVCVRVEEGDVDVIIIVVHDICQLVVMMFLSKAMSKVLGFTLTLPCLWQSILTALVVQCIERSEELVLFAIF